MKKVYAIVILLSLLFLTCCKSSGSSIPREKIIDAFDQVADSLKVNNEELLKQSYTFNKNDLIKAANDQADVIDSAKATALFIKNILVSGFNIDGITEDVVVNTPDQDFLIRLKVSSNENNEINAIFNADEDGKESIGYINFIIDYDYENNILNRFRVYLGEFNLDSPEAGYCDYFSYENDELLTVDKTSSNYSKYIEFVKDEQKDYESLKTSKERKDYSREYMKAMNIVFGDYSNIDIDNYKKDGENNTKLNGNGEYTINLSCKDSSVSIIPSNDIQTMHVNEYELVAYKSLDSLDLSDPSSWYIETSGINDFSNYVFVYHFKVKLNDESELENIKMGYNFRINSTSNINALSVIVSTNNKNVETNLRYEKSSEEKIINLNKGEEVDVTLYVFLNGEYIDNVTYYDYEKMCKDTGTIEIELVK